jgi:hypothetical protein
MGMMKQAFLPILSSFLLFACSTPPEPGSLSVSDAWVRAVPPASGITAAYMTILNDSEVADTLVSVTCDVSRVVEMHAVEVTSEGAMRMHRLKSIPVDAGGRLTLAPGGEHLMLIGLQQPMQVGVYVPLKMTFRKSGTQLVMARIRKE